MLCTEPRNGDGEEATGRLYASSLPRAIGICHVGDPQSSQDHASTNHRAIYVPHHPPISSSSTHSDDTSPSHPTNITPRRQKENLLLLRHQPVPNDPQRAGLASLGRKAPPSVKEGVKGPRVGVGHVPVARPRRGSRKLPASFDEWHQAMMAQGPTNALKVHVVITVRVQRPESRTASGDEDYA